MRDRGDEQVNVAFVDDHPTLLLGLASIFSEYKRFKVAATGCSAADARMIAETKHPELMLMDLSMPGDVFATIRHIAKHYSHTKVLVFTAFSSVDSAFRAMNAGAAGYVLKGSKCDEMFDAVDTVLSGQMYVTSHFANQVFSGVRSPDQREEVVSHIKLSFREKQIVRELMHAKTNREIATSLDITEKTVKNYMTSLMNKFHARNRVEVVIAAQKSSELN